MKKLLATSLIASSLFIGASPAAAQYAAYPDGREPAYYVTLYSDASHTTIVGYITPECGYAWVQYTLEGTYSIHSSQELIGYCTPWGLEP